MEFFRKLEPIFLLLGGYFTCDKNCQHRFIMVYKALLGNISVLLAPSPPTLLLQIASFLNTYDMSEN
jgi:hypothetical protein